MSRFFGSKKRPKKHITSAKEYYQEQYGKETEVEIDDREQEILLKLEEIGAVNIKKVAGYLTRYIFDLPVEHADDLYQRITMSEEGDKDVNIDAELIHEFPFFLNIMIKADIDVTAYESFEGMSIQNFVSFRTNNDKQTDTVLKDENVNKYFFPLITQIQLISINKNALSARLNNMENLGDFFKLMTYIVRAAQKK